MSRARAAVWRSLIVVFGLLLLTAGTIVAAVLVPPHVQELFIRGVAVAMLLFLIIVFIRYFVLLWFAYLGHAERNVLGAPKHQERPGISVLIPSYNEGPLIDRAIMSVLDLDYPEFELVVVDDGSTDDTLERAVEWEGRHGHVYVTVVTQRNAGKAAALNSGIEVSRHPFILCMDADSELEPQTLLRAIEHFSDASVGGVAGNVKVEKRDSFITRLQALEYIEGLNMPRRAQGFVSAVSIVPGPVGMFRREALEEIGGYETDTFAEDADLTIKMIAAGWRVVYEDDAIAWTQPPEKWMDLVQQRYRWTRGILQTARKRKGLFLEPFPDFPLWLSVVQFGFEALVWPAINIFAHAFFAIVLLLFGGGELIIYWVVLLTLLDVVAAILTLSMEEESLSLVPMAVVYRYFYLLFLDVVKMFATFEELFGIDMEWSKVARAEQSQ